MPYYGGPSAAVSDNRQTASYTLTAADTIVSFDCSASTLTATLPALSTWTNKTFTLKRVDAAAANGLVISSPSGVIEGGSASYTITQPNTAVTLYTNGTNVFIQNALVPNVPIQFYETANSKTVSNTTTTTSIVPTPTTGFSNTKPAGFLTQGKSIDIIAGGYYNIASVSTMNVALRVNGTTIGTTSMATGLGAVTNQLFRLNATIVVKTTGTTGTLAATGVFTLNGTTSNIGATTDTTIDTTVAPTIDVVVTFSVANAGNNITASIMKMSSSR